MQYPHMCFARELIRHWSYKILFVVRNGQIEGHMVISVISDFRMMIAISTVRAMRRVRPEIIMRVYMERAY